jgi:hypothetical protein
MTKTLNFIKTNLIAIFSLTFYFCWWLYLLFGFNTKDYSENNYAGGISIQGLAELTVILTVINIIGFLVAALVTRKWKKYLTFITLIFIPVIIAAIYSRH